MVIDNREVYERTIINIINDTSRAGYHISCPPKPCLNFKEDRKSADAKCTNCWFNYLTSEAAKELEIAMKETSATQEYGSMDTFKRK